MTESLLVNVRFVVLLLLCVACGDDSLALRHPDRLTVWAESLPSEEIDARFAFAGANRASVNVSLVQGVADTTFIAHVCDAAVKNDVELRFWPGVSQDLGYWAHQNDVDAYLNWTLQLVDIAHASCPRLSGVVVDMEMPIYKVNQLTQMRMAGTSNLAIAQWLLGGIDAAGFEAARAKFDAAGARVRAAGLTYSVSTLPMNADDYGDGDETIAKALWTPIEKIDWDAVSFQVYRSFFNSQVPSPSGQPYDSGLVTSYLQSIRAKWGSRAAIDLGTTGSGGVGIPPLDSAEDLQSDIAAALAAGIPVGRIAIYSLEGVYPRPDAAAWLAVPTPRAAPPTPVDDDARSTFQSLDLLGH